MQIRKFMEISFTFVMLFRYWHQAGEYRSSGDKHIVPKKSIQITPRVLPIKKLELIFHKNAKVSAKLFGVIDA
jgi:hypothetical protein